MGMYSHPNGPHPGASSSVRNAERLVQVKVRHITSIVTRATQPHLSVNVGPIHIDLVGSSSAHSTLCFEMCCELMHVLINEFSYLS